tara:strand:- start:37 stop:594 length:558 start_codon:yes stop_codon:yes gene_type:complete
MIQLYPEINLKIFSDLEFQLKCKLNKTCKLYNKIQKNDKKFIKMKQIFAANFIKFWWLSRDIGKTNIICIIKNNNIEEFTTKHILDNLICVYRPNRTTNIKYNARCKKYNEQYNESKNNYNILNCFRNTTYNKRHEQYVRLVLHPFTKLYLNNNPLTTDLYMPEIIIKHDNIYYNHLNYKSILFK